MGTVVVGSSRAEVNPRSTLGRCRRAPPRPSRAVLLAAGLLAAAGVAEAKVVELPATTCSRAEPRGIAQQTPSRRHSEPNLLARRFPPHGTHWRPATLLAHPKGGSFLVRDAVLDSRAGGARTEEHVVWQVGCFREPNGAFTVSYWLLDGSATPTGPIQYGVSSNLRKVWVAAAGVGMAGASSVQAQTVDGRPPRQGDAEPSVLARLLGLTEAFRAAKSRKPGPVMAEFIHEAELAALTPAQGHGMLHSWRGPEQAAASH